MTVAAISFVTYIVAGFTRIAWISLSLIHILVLTAGTTFLRWLGEQINEYGIGNGISLIIFAGIISRLPSGIQEIWVRVQDGTMSIVRLILFLSLIHI